MANEKQGPPSAGTSDDALHVWTLMPALAALCGATADGKQRVRFQGCEYLLIGNMKDGAAIATPEQYENGECSFAHLMPGGAIMRFRRQIGTLADLEVLPAPEGVRGGICDAIGADHAGIHRRKDDCERWESIAAAQPPPEEK